jgi:hypothetical protein
MKPMAIEPHSYVIQYIAEHHNVFHSFSCEHVIALNCRRNFLQPH